MSDLLGFITNIFMVQTMSIIQFRIDTVWTVS